MSYQRRLTATPFPRHLFEPEQDSPPEQTVLQDLDLAREHLSSLQMPRYVVVIISTVDMNLLFRFDDEGMLQFSNPTHLLYHNN
jgi:hypothetical protein